jgi:hypothetical protein
MIDDNIRTVQHILGHTKIEMTAKYLTPLKGKRAQDGLGAVFADVNLPSRADQVTDQRDFQISPCTLVS